MSIILKSLILKLSLFRFISLMKLFKNGLYRSPQFLPFLPVETNSLRRGTRSS